MTVPHQLGPVAAPKVTRSILALFAGASGDHNPVHIDLDAARSAGFDDVFAQGMLSMAYLGRLFTTAFGPGHLKEFRVRFSAVTPVLATPIMVATLTGVEKGLARYETTVTIDDGTVTLVGTAEVATDQ